ncbi:MAG TPA: phosphate signaling complex protein PhoU [Dehalococcoidia bacterium]|nr:phosphate signaling complex protein PhoU [Dehalococcoidia bacterium]
MLERSAGEKPFIKMVRAQFDQHLGELRQDVLDLGSMAERAIRQAMESLRRSDLALAREVVDTDYDINKRRYEIEEKAVDLIATQQPVATDLRTLVAAMHIVTELERIADHAEGNARITLMLGDQTFPRALGRLEEMADLGVTMMHRSLTAFIERDVELAKEVCASDDDLDSLYDSNYAEVIGRMLVDSSSVKVLTYELWAAHNLERIGDRSTNICERVIYLVTGKMEETNVSRY